MLPTLIEDTVCSPPSPCVGDGGERYVSYPPTLDISFPIPLVKSDAESATRAAFQPAYSPTFLSL
nr:MAG TPA: hypothetical protein [Caudoviricetes sp.]